MMSGAPQNGIRQGSVLLLEDSALDCGLIYEALQQAGFDARHHQVTNAANLIAALESQNWDAVVSQFKLPGFSGYDALRLVRSMGQDIPFFFVCEKLDESVSVPVVKAGADSYILKSDLNQLSPALSLEIGYSAKRSKHRTSHHEMIVKDQAARQQIENRLSDIERAWRLMFDNSPVALMLQLPFSSITNVNDRMIELSGYAREELIGKTAEETGLRVDDELGRHFLEVMKTQGFTSGLDLRWRRKDGVVRTVIISSRAVILDGTTYQLHSIVDITNQTQAMEAANISQKALASISQGVLISGPDRMTLSVNAAFETMTGYTQAELVGQSCSILQGPKTSPESIRQIKHSLASDQPFFGELLNYRKDGSTFWNELTLDQVFDDEGKLSHIVGIQRDITLLKSQQAQLKLSAQMFAQCRESVVVADASGQIVMVNDAFSEISGYAKTELAGKALKLLTADRQDEGAYSTMWDTVNETGTWSGETWSRRKDGVEYPEWLTISLVRNEQGDICNYVCTSSDTSERLAAREQIAKLNHFDQLTGLPNRLLLSNRCTHDISIARREGKSMAMMVLGVDHFEMINDTLGQPTSDMVLKQFVKRLITALREQDTLARVGSDEFVLVLPGTTPEGASLLATKLLCSAAQPFQVEGVEVRITASIGIAIFPADGLDFETLIKSADVAMHQAKGLGRGKYGFFSSEMFDNTLAQVALVAALRTAIPQDQLRLHYQPFVDMQTGRIAGMEALLRWTSPTLGSVSPACFIPIAEQSGLIIEIGSWVLRQACHDIRDWVKQGLDVPHISINVSPLQIRDPGFLQIFETTLREFDIDPFQICVEVTEGALMEDVKHSEAQLRSLKGLGLTLALDDFGTGYSSLSYLKQFPFDKVKIDKSFIGGIHENAQDAVITKVVISMAHSLGLHVIAEGVETEAQCEFLRANMCDEIQGYFFSRAVPKNEIEALLSADRRLPDHLIRVQKKQRTLLLVDDEPNVISSLKRLMRRDGYIILSASNGNEALELLKRNQVDVIVSDQRMPGMTGVELLRRAKSLCPDTVRIVLSGYAELQSVTDAINDGSVYRFLTKPWDDEQLRSFVNEAFNHKDLTNENRQLNLRLQTLDQELATCQRQMLEMQRSKQRQEVSA